MDPGRAAYLVALMLAPTAAAAAAVYLPRVARLVREHLRAERQPVRPVGPPLEQIAADLRRLLALHEAEVRSPGRSVRAARLGALRAAISDTAVDAARALEVPVPHRQGRSPLPLPALTDLLHALADAGLVLPGHERFPGAVP